MKVCFVSIIGRPNVGKSSLLNEILNYNLSIVTDTPQTTRDQINGIYNEDNYQIVFIDTPGIHKSKQKLGEFLNHNSYESLKNADLILFLQPANEKIAKGDLMIIDKIKSFKNKIAIITKVDLEPNMEKLTEKSQELKKLGFDLILGTSTSNKLRNTVDELIDEIKKYTYESEPFYLTDDITDKSMRFLAKEIIRKNAINLLKDELPHNIAVMIDDFIEYENHMEISCTIYVSKDSQKGILIGKNGTMIKKIGMNSRKELEQAFYSKIILNTHIKVSKNWNNDEKQIKKMGY
ncbi:GTPase Era [Mesomycoplasma lagogenitalium]|uniref:GTPase Era n=1 Tax=Mesomycoplasma lagogenitalium TaxID=171286 RepID=A0ABY8LUU9_9BACT|nr:GTPase Era [Mesomycoplasma lagogenitalium]WGI37010.1 GTPase Era [Mesomycoplasma lagogenitalium]